MNTDKNWFAVEITVIPQASEAVEFAFNELDALGTEINNLGKDKSKESLCVVGYFNEKPNENFLKNQLTEALRIYNFDQAAIKNIAWREGENKDWLAEWKKHWKPTRVGKFIVAPTWSDIETGETDNNLPGSETIIRIDPEMAFGTGTHETTRLCLQAIEENYRAGMDFLDVGTGTGILAIAAAKLKSQNKVTRNSIAACDTDETSIGIARKNAALNDVDKDIDFYVGSIKPDTPIFDFVCANLTADVIAPLLPELYAKTKIELVLSGILCEQQCLIEGELEKLRASNWSVQTLGEWLSIKVKK